ncbi:MAG: radical SAM protein [Candidatus Tectomicrobia bacterium]|nr:radical SAM protein [Candidatus Tectomicrobia bacterium]
MAAQQALFMAAGDGSRGSLPRTPRQAEVAARRNGVEYVELPCRTLLNKTTNPHLSFTWTINPYRGCEFGCAYCYARYTHEFMGYDDPANFERRIFVKTNAAPALARQARAQHFDGRPIALGTATDPYQPAERLFRVTRGILETLRRYPKLRLSIVTKSALVKRDTALLAELARRGAVTVGFTIITLDRRLARTLEPRAATPQRRLRTMRHLHDAGVPVALLVSPILPHLTDAAADLERLIIAARQAGAATLRCNPLWLSSSSRKTFFPWLRQHFPQLLPAYRRIYSQGMYQSEAYITRVTSLMARLAAKHGLAYGTADEFAPEGNEAPGTEAPPQPQQLTLAGS